MSPKYDSLRHSQFQKIEIKNEDDIMRPHSLASIHAAEALSDLSMMHDQGLMDGLGDESNSNGDVYKLHCRSGNFLKSFDLTSEKLKEGVTIGRSCDNMIQFDIELVSRKHLNITLDTTTHEVKVINLTKSKLAASFGTTRNLVPNQVYVWPCKESLTIPEVELTLEKLDKENLAPRRRTLTTNQADTPKRLIKGRKSVLNPVSRKSFMSPTVSSLQKQRKRVSSVGASDFCMELEKAKTKINLHLAQSKISDQIMKNKKEKLKLKFLRAHVHKQILLFKKSSLNQRLKHPLSAKTQQEIKDFKFPEKKTQDVDISSFKEDVITPTESKKFFTPKEKKTKKRAVKSNKQKKILTDVLEENELLNFPEKCKRVPRTRSKASAASNTPLRRSARLRAKK